MSLIDAGPWTNLFCDEIYYFTKNHDKFYGVEKRMWTAGDFWNAQHKQSVTGIK